MKSSMEHRGFEHSMGISSIEHNSLQIQASAFVHQSMDWEVGSLEAPETEAFNTLHLSTRLLVYNLTFNVIEFKIVQKLTESLNFSFSSRFIAAFSPAFNISVFRIFGVGGVGEELYEFCEDCDSSLILYKKKFIKSRFYYLQ